MLRLKPLNIEDADEEYRAITLIPADENGFENKYHDISKQEFIRQVIPLLIRNSQGIDLPQNYVPSTCFFLWDDNRIVGLFKIRHYLNDFLRNGAGHIGYGILANERGKGYATAGLKLAIQEAAKIIPEDEIYFSVHKNNPASLRVQQKCGAYIAGESTDGTEYLTRIKLK